MTPEVVSGRFETKTSSNSAQSIFSIHPIHLDVKASLTSFLPSFIESGLFLVFHNGIVDGTFPLESVQIPLPF
jgi:hypothetical protein